jgi:hypothetical protein
MFGRFLPFDRLHKMENTCGLARSQSAMLGVSEADFTSSVIFCYF